MSACRRGVSLIEVVLAVAVVVAVTMATITYVRQPRDKVTLQACELQRSSLQLRVDEYERQLGRWPSVNLRELNTPSNALPVCPIDGRSYRLDSASGDVLSHAHNQ